MCKFKIKKAAQVKENFQRVGLFVIGFLLCSLSLSAQSDPDKLLVKGKIIDADTRAPLPYATIGLFSQQDSALVAGGITDDDGAFALEAQAGFYYVSIDFLGYTSQSIEKLSLSEEQSVIDLGVIAIQAEATDLEEVVVEGEREQVQLALDKKIFNVSQDPINAGRTAADILGNLPSVTVDGDGNVSLRGSGNVQILIDGKPSGLLSFDGAEGLRQLQGNLVENVEIITNPSARYQAEGMAGIINIVLKKERNRGINGSFDFTVGQPDNYGAAINMNYRREKLNFFVNYGIFYRNITNRNNTLYQEVLRNDTTFITRQRTINRQSGFSNNIQLGADYFFNERNIVTTSFTYRYNKGKRNSEIEYMDAQFSRENLQSITRRYQDENEIEPNLEYALNYKRTFQQEGHELTALLSYIDNWEDSKQLFTESFFNPDYTPSERENRLQRSLNYETEKQLLLQADYVHPFSDKGKLEAGIRNTLRDITNDYLVDELNEQQHWIPLPGLDNDFLYDENIYAAYLIAGNKINKFSYQLGLRSEYSDVKTELLREGDENRRTYLNSFPSAHFTYDLRNENAVQISYSRRLHRPTYNDLSPFFTFVDNRNFMSGNPDLNPEYTHAIEAGHLKNFEQASLSSALYYRHTTGKIERIRSVDEEGNAIIQPQNLSTEDAFGAEFISTLQPFSWWKMEANFNFFRAITDGSNLDQSFQSDTYSWFTRLTSRFTLWGNTDMQFRGSYEAPQQTPQGKRLATYFLDLAITRDILRNKGTLTLNASDIFNSNRSRTIVEGDNFYTETDFLRRPRQINLTLNYRLNQKKGESKSNLEME